MAEKVVMSKKPRPFMKSWSTDKEKDKILFEVTFAASKRGRLFAKLLIFRNARALSSFWKRVVNPSDKKHSNKVAGLVTPLIVVKGDTVEVDPNYFCAIGLDYTQCDIETLAHEATHAADCYCERLMGRNPYARYCKNGGRYDEIYAHPTGIIAKQLDRAVKLAGEKL